MGKEVGKVYNNLRTYIICTGEGKSEKTFSGVVVRQDDETSDHQIGDYSTTWTEGVFNETDDSVIIDNKTWKKRLDIGTCLG